MPPVDDILVVEFGHPDWQTHLGGSFHGPETNGDLRWNWIGEEPCWVVLPELRDGNDYRVTLEAAPFWMPGTRWFEVDVLVAGTVVTQWRVPLNSKIEMSADQLASLAGASASGAPFSVSLRELPTPELQLTLGEFPVIQLRFDPDAGIQKKDFLLRGDLVAWGGHTLFMAPSYAVQPGVSDPRKLSFRLLRMTLQRLGKA